MSRGILRELNKIASFTDECNIKLDSSNKCNTIADKDFIELLERIELNKFEPKNRQLSR